MVLQQELQPAALVPSFLGIAAGICVARREPRRLSVTLLLLLTVAATLTVPGAIYTATTFGDVPCWTLCFLSPFTAMTWVWVPESGWMDLGAWEAPIWGASVAVYAAAGVAGAIVSRLCRARGAAP